MLFVLAGAVLLLAATVLLLDEELLLAEALLLGAGVPTLLLPLGVTLSAILLLLFEVLLLVLLTLFPPFAGVLAVADTALSMFLTSLLTFALWTPAASAAAISA